MPISGWAKARQTVTLTAAQTLARNLQSAPSLAFAQSQLNSSLRLYPGILSYNGSSGSVSFAPLNIILKQYNLTVPDFSFDNSFLLKNVGQVPSASLFSGNADATWMYYHYGVFFVIELSQAQNSLLKCLNNGWIIYSDGIFHIKPGLDLPSTITDNELAAILALFNSFLKVPQSEVDSVISSTKNQSGASWSFNAWGTATQTAIAIAISAGVTSYLSQPAAAIADPLPGYPAAGSAVQSYTLGETTAVIPANLAGAVNDIGLTSSLAGLSPETSVIPLSLVNAVPDTLTTSLGSLGEPLAGYPPSLLDKVISAGENQLQNLAEGVAASQANKTVVDLLKPKVSPTPVSNSSTVPAMDQSSLNQPLPYIVLLGLGLLALL